MPRSSQHRRFVRRYLAATAGVVVLITGLAWAGLATGTFVGFERAATDSFFPAAPTSSHVTVVGIDAKSVNQVGAYPWSRDVWAQLVNRLDQDGAAVVAFDIIFSPQRPGDADLATALARAHASVLGAQFNTNPSSGSGPPVAVMGTFPVAPMAQAATAIAHVEVNADAADGIVRSLPLYVQSNNGALLPALSLAAVMAYRHQNVNAPPTFRPEGVQVGNRLIPTDDTTAMTVNFSQTLTDPTKVISAVNLLDGKVPAKAVAGKIVLVGVTDPTLGDQRLVPTEKSTGLPGVLIHANAINTMLTGDYLVHSSQTATLLWTAALAALMALLVLLLPVWASTLAGLVLLGGYLWLTLVEFDRGTVMDLVYPTLGLIVAYVASMALRYFGETRQRRKVTALFSQYVPGEVARRLIDEDRVAAAIQGERVDLSVIFCDLRGFTSLSATLEPTDVRTMLNCFYKHMAEAVLSNDGTIMKYVGDEVFAVFGAPLPNEHHREAAIACALAMQRSLPELDHELSGLGIPSVRFGIGVNSGPAVAAHFGDGRRRQYDVVGDTVNIGARLCGVAKDGEIVCSAAVLEGVDPQPPHEPLGPVALKGVTRDLGLVRLVVDGTQQRPSEQAGMPVGTVPA
jgi:adenylate cyclase